MSVAASVLQPNQEGPLSGKRVVAFTHILAGPFCVANLRDLGAEVIVVDAPGQGDATRGYTPFRVANDNTVWKDDKTGKQQSLFHAALNSGNKTIQLNLKSADDRIVMLDLITKADVFVYNQIGTTMDKLGIGHDRLKQLNKGKDIEFGDKYKDKFNHLIECHISGDMYNQEGAYDLKAMADAGVLQAIAKVDEIQYSPGLSLADLVTGMEAAKDITAALLRRQEDMEAGKPRSGELIKVSMITAIRNFFRMMFAGVSQRMVLGLEPNDPKGLGLGNPSISPFASYKCGDGKDMIICCGTDDSFKNLANILKSEELKKGLEDVDDENNPGKKKPGKYANNSNRVENNKSLRIDIEEALKGKSSTEWVKELTPAKIVVAPVLPPSEIIRGYQESGALPKYFREVKDENGETVFYAPQRAWFEKDAKDLSVNAGLPTTPIQLASTDPNANGEEIRHNAGSWIGPSAETRLMGIGMPGYALKDGMGAVRSALSAILGSKTSTIDIFQNLSTRTLDALAGLVANDKEKARGVT